MGPPLALAATAAGSWLAPDLPGAPLVLAAGGVAGLLAAWRVRAGWARVLLAVLACGSLGNAAAGHALAGQRNHPLRGAVASGRPLLLWADVAGDPAPWRWSTDVVVRVRAVAALGAGGLRPEAAGPAWTPVRATRVLVRATGDDARRLAALRSGDRVLLDAELTPLDGFDRRRRWEHVVALARRPVLMRFAPGGSPLERMANAVRDRLAAGMRMLPADDRALLAGFLLGDTRALPDQVRNEFRASGLSHVLAVSGANVAFVLGLLAPVLQRLRLGLRFAATLGVLALFATVTRYEPSVLRAGGMAAVAAFGSLLGRPVSALRRLCDAAVLLLVADPFLVHSVGFGLSLGASAGIVLLAAGLARRIPGPPWLRASLSVSVAAQVGVLPVSLAVFGTVPGIAPVANLFAVPAAEPVTVIGLLVSALLGSVSGGLRSFLVVLQWPVIGLVGWVRLVARVGAQVPLGLDARGSAVVAAIGAWWAYRRRNRGGAGTTPRNPAGRGR